MSNMKENTFNRLPNDDEVESRARAIFESACGNADSYHTLRLGLARCKALEAGKSGHAARTWAPLAGAAVACCALVAGVVLMRPVAHVTPATQVVASAPIAAAPAGDVDEAPVVGGNQMEMVQDLDFYRWLASQSDVASAPGGSGH